MCDLSYFRPLGRLIGAHSDDHTLPHIFASTDFFSTL